MRIFKGEGMMVKTLKYWNIIVMRVYTAKEHYII